MIARRRVVQFRDGRSLESFEGIPVDAQVVIEPETLMQDQLFPLPRFAD